MDPEPPLESNNREKKRDKITSLTNRVYKLEKAVELGEGA
jgi:hypothetical protein